MVIGGVGDVVRAERGLFKESMVGVVCVVERKSGFGSGFGVGVCYQTGKRSLRLQPDEPSRICKSLRLQDSRYCKAWISFV